MYIQMHMHACICTILAQRKSPCRPLSSASRLYIYPLSNNYLHRHENICKEISIHTCIHIIYKYTRMCMSLCKIYIIHTYIYIHMYIYINWFYIRICYLAESKSPCRLLWSASAIYACINTVINMYMCIYKYIYMYMYVCVYIYMYVNMYMNLYVYMHIYIHVYV